VEFQKERGQQKHGIRLFALWKLQEGMSQTEVCHVLSKTHKTLQLWRTLYESGGLDRLLSIGSGRGRKALLTDKKAFQEAVEGLSAQQQGGRIRCQDIVDMVLRDYAVAYTCSGMYSVLHRFGFSWITSRSKHPQQDVGAIEAFKKTS
jgi:transposase